MEKKIDWKRITPFFVTLLIIPVTMAVTKSVDFGRMQLACDAGPGITPPDYLLTQFRVIVTYIRLLFIPVNQNLDYDYAISRTLFDIPTLSSLILLAVILIAAVKIFRSHRLVSFGIFWFFLTLLPESSVIPIKDVIFEHRLYLPMAGYAIFLVSAAYYIFGEKNIRRAIIILSIVSIAYSTLAYNRNIVWKESLALWEDTARKSPNKARPLSNRGGIYLSKGDVDQVISDSDKAIGLDPKNAEAYNNRAGAYLKKGNIDQAISDCDKAIELELEYAEIYNNRGTAYLAKGDIDMAISDCNKAIELDPGYKAAYIGRGNAYQGKGDIDRAINDYNKAIELDPGYAIVYYNRGTAYLGKGDIDRAISDLDRAIALNPDYYEAYVNRGIAYSRKGDTDRSISDYDKAIEINPGNAFVYNNRAMAYFKKGQYSSSWDDVGKAQELGCEVNPGFIEALKKASGR